MDGFCLDIGPVSDGPTIFVDGTAFPGFWPCLAMSRTVTGREQS